RGSDMVLAAHFTHVNCGVTTTLETVRFQRPERIDFRLVRGPVPHLVESFLLTPNEAGTELCWQGELGTDLWRSAPGGADGLPDHGHTPSGYHYTNSPPKPNAAHTSVDE